ncbi:hypothetical protein FZ103_09120 [Streptomonospora sp. PA3]|uniref:hypothetical protein n=1 Tax=Streptomonospora sp. PA3 TaxID=2607326 RepID=UPI0012DF2403|nr:hypothetical protein [Streptomonospora sp. PA3]MUL41337.1 hypothetical protein [Streptomonospora sp. PA3]
MSRYAAKPPDPGVWRPAPGWPAPGQEGTLVLRPGATGAQYARFIGPYAPLLILLFLVTTGIGAIFFETAAEGTGTVAGIAVGLVATGAMGGLLAVRVHRMLTRTTVVVSPVGVELRDHLGVEIRLAWPDARVGDVTTRFSPDARAGRPGGVRVSTPEYRSHGLIGYGDRVLPRRMPRHMARRLAAQPRDPHTGRPLVAIPFTAAGTRQPPNPLVDAARHYRPDLFA